ncbi:hypothetical protein [Sinomicrobium sp. M5D2P9]
MNKPLKQSILVSYLIGAPIGIFTVIAILWGPVLLTGEGILTMVIAGAYGIPAAGLLTAFLIALWFGGKSAYEHTRRGNPLLMVSSRYSLQINAMIWGVFCILLGVMFKENSLVFMLPAFVAFFACTGITTFTIGLWIAYLIRHIHRKHNSPGNTVIPGRTYA